MAETAFETLVIASLSELKAEVVAVGTTAEQGLNIATKTYEQAMLTNGRVAVLETWRDGFEDEGENAQSFEAGRQSRRAEDVAMAKRALNWLTKALPWGAGALLVGIGIRLGAWFVGGLW